MKRRGGTTTSTTESAVSESSNKGDMRDTMKMPAVTMVAAWIRPRWGRPSMESATTRAAAPGQTCHGAHEQEDADDRGHGPGVAVDQFDALPCQLRCLGEHHRVIQAAGVVQHQRDTQQETEVAHAVDQEGLEVGVDGGLARKPEPMSSRDRPTASQPKNSCRKLLAVTSISMEKVNSEM